MDPNSLTVFRRLILIILSVFFNLFTAGIIFGFDSLKDVLKKEGIYSHLCSATDCHDQELRFQLLFTLATVSTNVSALLIGWVIDSFGPKVAMLTGSLLFLLGNLCYIFSSNVWDFFIPGYIFFAVGGPFIFISTLHLSRSFTVMSGLIMAFLTCAFDASSILFPLFKFLHERFSISRSNLFTFLLVVPISCFLFALFLMPKSSFEQTQLAEEPTTKKLEKVIEEDLDFNDPEQPLLGFVPDSFGFNLKSKPFLKQIRHWAFWALTVFLCLFMLRLNFYMASIENQLKDLFSSQVETVKEIRFWFSLLLPLGGVLAVLPCAFLLDYFTLDVCYAVISLMGLLFGIGSMIPIYAVQLIAIVIFVVKRPILYTAISEFCAQIYGFKTFGKVYGLLVLISGLFNFSQYLLAYTALNLLQNHYFWLNMGLTIAAFLISFYFCFHLVISKRKTKKQSKQHELRPESEE